MTITNKTNGLVSWNIYSVSGQKVLSGTTKAGEVAEMQLHNLSGSYILRAVAEDGSTMTKRFIMQ